MTHACTSLPSSLDGVPVFVRRTTPIEASHGGDNCPGGYCHDEQFTLPVAMGNAAADDDKCVAGTLGFKACLIAGSVAYDTFVTAQHCVFNDLLCEGVPFGNDRYLHRDCSGQMVGKLFDIGDSAFETCTGTIKLDSAVFSTVLTQTINVVRDIGVPSFTAGVPQVGDMVQKSGRATGRTFGQIEVVGISDSYNIQWTKDPKGPCCDNPLSYASSSLLWVVPPGEALAGTGHGSVSASDLGEVDALLADFGARGSADFGVAMSKIRGALHNQKLLGKLGVQVQ